MWRSEPIAEVHIVREAAPLPCRQRSPGLLGVVTRSASKVRAAGGRLRRLFPLVQFPRCWCQNMSVFSQMWPRKCPTHMIAMQYALGITSTSKQYQPSSAQQSHSLPFWRETHSTSERSAPHEPQFLRSCVSLVGYVVRGRLAVDQATRVGALPIQPFLVLRALPQQLSDDRPSCAKQQTEVIETAINESPLHIRT